MPKRGRNKVSFEEFNHDHVSWFNFTRHPESCLPVHHCLKEEHQKFYRSTVWFSAGPFYTPFHLLDLLSASGAVPLPALSPFFLSNLPLKRAGNTPSGRRQLVRQSSQSARVRSLANTGREVLISSHGKKIQIQYGHGAVVERGLYDQECAASSPCIPVMIQSFKTNAEVGGG